MMKKVLLSFIAAFTIVSCSVESTNEDVYNNVDLTSLSEAKFIDYMEQDALANGFISEPINADASVYPLGIESVVAYNDLNKMFPFDNPDFGNCVNTNVFNDTNGDEKLATLNIAKIKDEDDDDATKFTYTFDTEPGWYIYSVLMDIKEDCGSIPVGSNGVPNVCNFNVRNCFGNNITKVTYKFRDNCLADCTCNSVYVLLYNRNADGSRNQSRGLWVDGDQFGDTIATTNSYCKNECGDNGGGGFDN